MRVSFDIILRALKIAVSQERVALIISAKSRYLQSLLGPEEITRISNSIQRFSMFLSALQLFSGLSLCPLLRPTQSFRKS